MAVIMNTANHQLKCLIGGLFFFTGISCNTNGGDLTHDVTINSMVVKFDMEKVTDEYSWVNGTEFISINDTPYLCMYDAETNNIIVANVYEDTPTLQFTLPDEIDAFWAKDNALEYVCKDDLSKVRTISIDKHNRNKWTFDEYVIPKLFNDSFFISSIYLSKVVALKNNDLLIPYRARNESPNLLDTFAYIHFKEENGILKDHKMIKNPSILMKEYEYLRFPICTYYSVNESIFYTFHKGDSLYSYSFIDNSTKSVKLDPLDTKKFDAKPNDVTFLRKYLKDNDKIERIIVTPKGFIYLFMTNNSKSKSKSTIVVYNNNLVKVAELKLTEQLDPSIGFVKNEKIFIYKASSHNQFYSFDISPINDRVPKQ